MSAEVIRFWEGPHADHIRIPGPGDDKHDAKIIILPVLHRRPITQPRKPRTNRRTKP